MITEKPVLKNITLGEGRPAVIVPIVETTEEAILAKARELASLPYDITEWRADFFEGLTDKEAVVRILEGLQDILKDKALLFTVRTVKEGGEADLAEDVYIDTLINAAFSGHTDLADVEMLKEEPVVRAVVEACHKAGVYVVGSNHDFHKTPEKEEIVRRLTLMDRLGADVLKIAVMPESKRDVLTLLDATLTMEEQGCSKPVLTMSMSGLGSITRLTGEVFSSCATFGSVGKSSAPGQIPLEKLITVLDTIHDSL